VISTLALLLADFWWEILEWIYLVIDPMVSKVILTILIEFFVVGGLFKNMAICLFVCFVCCFMFT
jgi:hypothetical protein